MAGTTNFLTVRDNNDGRTEFFEQLDGAGTTAPAIRLQGTVTVQVSGTATDLVAVVERSSRNPGSGDENWAPVEEEPFAGDLSAGMSPREYAEPAIGWWRVRVPTLTGGHIKVSIVGESA